MPRPSAGLLGPAQQQVIDALAVVDEPMTVTAIAEAIGRPGHGGRVRVDAIVASLENRGLVHVERKTVIAFAPDGPIAWREPEAGEAPTHHEGDPVPGRQGEVFAVDVVVERRIRPIVGSLVSLTPEGRERASSPG